MTTLLDWLWATLLLALPLLSHPSLAVGIGALVGGYTLGHAAAGKDGLALRAVLSAAPNDAVQRIYRLAWLRERWEGLSNG